MIPKRDDPTSLGAILVAAGLVTREELRDVLEAQGRSTIYEVLGRLAVRKGLITADQLEASLEAQAGLRSKSKAKRALAQARIVELSATLVQKAASRLRREAAEVRRIKTGQEFPVVRKRAASQTDH